MKCFTTIKEAEKYLHEQYKIKTYECTFELRLNKEQLKDIEKGMLLVENDGVGLIVGLDHKFKDEEERFWHK